MLDHLTVKVDFCKFKCLRCVVGKIDITFLAKEYASFAADAKVVRFVLEIENCLKHLSSSSMLVNPLFLTTVCKI